jgi:hypothetical protein
MAAVERLGVKSLPETEEEGDEFLAGAAALHLVGSDRVYGQLGPIEGLSPCLSWPDRPLGRHDSVVQLEENKTFLAGPYPEVRYVPGIIAAILGAGDDTVFQTPMLQLSDDDLVAYTEESREMGVIDEPDRQDTENTNTSHRANSISVSQTPDSCAPVPVSAAASFPYGLTEHIRATQNDEVLDPADAIAAGHTAIARPSVCRPVWESKNAVSAPSPKFLRAFRAKKASVGSIKSSIHVPTGIIAAHPTVEIGVDGEEVDTSSYLEQHSVPGYISVGERVREGLLTPETSRFQDRDVVDEMGSDMLWCRNSQHTDLPAYPLSGAQGFTSAEERCREPVDGSTSFTVVGGDDSMCRHLNVEGGVVFFWKGRCE